MVAKKIPLLLFCLFLIFFAILFFSKTQQTCAYDQGKCGAGDICYTGPDGPDVAPGYACGTDPATKDTYVYSNDANSPGYIVSCFSGACCTKGNRNIQLPLHKDSQGNYELGAQKHSNCAPTSICFTGKYTGPAKTGQQCGDLSGWFFGTGGGSGQAPSCSGTPNTSSNGPVCCDTVASTPTPPNPCPSENGICTQIDTAVGTIDVSGPGGFIGAVFGILLSLAGGTALILIIFSGYQIMTAQGDPEKVKAAQERLTSGVIGLLFMIFSVTILQILGVDILHIPGFGK